MTRFTLRTAFFTVFPLVCGTLVGGPSKSQDEVLFCENNIVSCSGTMPITDRRQAARSYISDAQTALMETVRKSGVLDVTLDLDRQMIQVILDGKTNGTVLFTEVTQEFSQRDVNIRFVVFVNASNASQRNFLEVPREEVAGHDRFRRLRSEIMSVGGFSFDEPRVLHAYRELMGDEVHQTSLKF